MRHYLLPMLLVSFIQLACETNVLSLAETKDPAEQAAAYLDADQPDDAIDILESAMKDEPDNYTYVSLLASAKAQKAGIDITSFVIRLADGDTVQSSNQMVMLFGALPEASAANLRLLGEAVRLMATIPSTDLIPADSFKSSVFGTAYSALQIRAFDSDGSGNFSIDELSTLDETSALAILTALDSAIANSSSYKTADGQELTVEKISSIRTKIDEQEGATTAEKLRNYLGSQASTSSGSRTLN